MATVTANGFEHEFAPNPKFTGDNWADEYPPIPPDAPYLRNKYTNEIVPNFPDYAVRSDILEPYYPTDAETVAIVVTPDELVEL